ncbi:MAG: hypothetical protein Aurels2KO_36670 [Aureliella sp.]
MFRFGIVATLFCCFAAARVVVGQPPQLAPPVLASPGGATVAVAGQPMGVYSLEIPLPAGVTETDFQVLVADTGGRAFFPTYTVIKQRVRGPASAAGGLGIGRPGGLIDRIRNAVRTESEATEVPVAIRVYGLFQGDQPFDLQIEGSVSRRPRVVPLRSGRSAQGDQMHRRLLGQWWQAYVDRARTDVSQGDFPRLVHRYMLSMLARRLGLPQEDLDPPTDEDEKESETVTLRTLSLLAGIDAKREQSLERLLSESVSFTPAELPLPSPPDWAEDQRLAGKRPVGAIPTIESLASCVPPECFYLRFGSFGNYVWFQELAERFGGDIAQAVQVRGFNAEASARMERMLATKLTTVAKMFGDKLVADMAVVGRDLYLKEGASLGVIMQANNIGLLKSTTESERKKVAASDPTATLQTLQVAGREVSLLSTPDNRIRSFMVAEKNFLFVTTSRTLVRRFLETAGGGESLADTPEFQWTRQWMPTESDYSVFAYFSPRFFHQLVSPEVQIELARRLDAIGRLEIASVASRAAEAEATGRMTLTELEQDGYLPVGFTDSPDGSQPVRSQAGWIDSVRGARGSFLPIADVEIAGVTETEAAEYAETASFFAEQWQQMDPLVFGLRRFSGVGKGPETVAFEGYIAPFDADKYGWIGKQLGQPTTVQFRQPVSDAVSLQLHMRGGSALATSDQDYYLFGGLKDTTPPDFSKVDGLLGKFTAFADLPAYIGAWPKPDLVESLPLGIGRNFARPDFDGYSKMRIGLWRWQNDTMSLMSFDRGILDEARASVAPVAATDSAQVRLNVVDLTGTQLGRWVDGVWYQRAWDASVGNVKLLHTISQQLKVRPAEARDVAQGLLDVKLQCPLGGQYELVANDRGVPMWESSQWRYSQRGADGKMQPPANYSAPWVSWFRGGQLHITQQPDSLAAVGQFELDMPPLPANLDATPMELPKLDFNIFSLPGKLFGDGEEKSAPVPSRRKF